MGRSHCSLSNGAAAANEPDERDERVEEGKNKRQAASTQRAYPRGHRRANIDSRAKKKESIDSRAGELELVDAANQIINTHRELGCLLAAALAKSSLEPPDSIFGCRLLLARSRPQSGSFSSSRCCYHY